MDIPQRSLGQILVTGANGFLGAALTAELKKRRIQVVATDVAGHMPLLADMIDLDVRDGPAVRALMEHTHFDTVFHCGAVSALTYHREHGLDTVTPRFSWIYGPGRKTPTTLAALLANSLTGATTRVEGHPANMTHYLYIDDAVDGLLRAATVAALKEERVFNITAGAGAPFLEMLDRVREVVPGVRIDFHAEPTAVSGPSGFSQERAEAVLGYRAQTSFKAGLARILQTLRAAA